MGKIIVDNRSSQDDELALQAVLSVVKLGFISGDNQYCWCSQLFKIGVDVLARKTRGCTHSFVVLDSGEKKQ